MSAATLFGVPLFLPSDSRDAWSRILIRSWTALMDRGVGELSHDLDLMAPLFATGAKVKALKDRIAVFAPADDHTARLPDEVLMTVDGCALITPEGRILLDVLLKLQRIESNVIDTELQVSALDESVALRSKWHRTWIRKQFDGPLSAAPLGAAVLLLLNGSTGESRALRMSSDDRQDRELGSIVLPMIAKFSQQLGGRVPDTSGGLQKHWAFTQVSRLLPRYVARERRDAETLMFVRPGQEPALLAELERRLSKTATLESRFVAINGLVADYREVRGRLVAVEQMFEDPTVTRRLVSRLTAPEVGGE